MVTDVPYPLLVLEAVVLLLLVSIWLLKTRLANRRFKAHARREAQLRREAGAGRSANGASDPRLDPRAVREAARHIPIPWGWPNHELQDYRTVSEQVAELGQRLVRRREVARSRFNDPRVANSFRALIEDRYQRVDRLVMPAITYEKVKAPRLRDPNLEPDQMDDFGQQQSIMNGRALPDVGRVVSVRPAAAAKKPASEPVRIENIRRPWGW